MLHEYRDEISALKQENAHFAKIFEKHNELDQQTTDADEGRLHLADAELEQMKKEKLLLKDEALMMILKYRKEQQENA
ncbi:MAG: YdcH family protein [Sulfurimonas sp.]